MVYKAIDIAKKLIFLAQQDEANGGECLTNLKLQKLLYYVSIQPLFWRFER